MLEGEGEDAGDDMALSEAREGPKREAGRARGGRQGPAEKGRCSDARADVVMRGKGQVYWGELAS